MMDTGEDEELEKLADLIMAKLRAPKPRKPRRGATEEGKKVAERILQKKGIRR